VKGSIIVMDRGYNDYTLYARWTNEAVFFVTRLKENADYRILEKRTIPQNRNILVDRIISFNGLHVQKKCLYPLRLIVVWNEQKQEKITLLTNHLTFGASTLAAIYKDRWQIEIFFKTLKQNLKVKTFVGTSGNTLYIQIWTALIAMLLIKYLQFKSKFRWSLFNLVAFFRWNLFTYRNLWDWIDKPFDIPPLIPKPVQYTLPLTGFGQQ
jgi:IS4 transposase